MIRRPPRSTQSRSSAASDVYKRQDLFYTHGRHSLKFGTLINYYQAQVGGHFSQKQTITFNNFTNFLKGLPQQMSGTDPNGDQQKLFLYETFGYYLQDDFRATSRLTLNL